MTLSIPEFNSGSYEYATTIVEPYSGFYESDPERSEPHSEVLHACINLKEVYCLFLI